MSLGGATLSFNLKGGRAAAHRFVEGLIWIAIATSLGSVYTTVELPADLDFAEEQLGTRAASFEIPAGLIRLSVGAEAFGDIDREIRQALEAAE